MGNKQTTDSKSKITDGILTFAVLSCENSSAFLNEGAHEEVIRQYSKDKLTVSINYNNNKVNSVSSDYVKNAIFNKGIIQYPFVQSVHSCTISISSTSPKSPKYRDYTFDISKYNQGEIIPLVFKDVNSTDDGNSLPIDGSTVSGASQSTDSVVLNVLFTVNIKTLTNDPNSLIKKTRSNGDHLSIVCEENYKDLDNGDIILYSGSSPVSEIIRDRFYRPWSHVGSVIKTYPFINHVKGQVLSEEPVLYVIEACGKENIKDPFRKNQSLTGINIFPLKERLNEYEGYCVQAIKLAKPFNERQKERYLTNCFELHGERLSFDVFQASVLLLERLKKWNWTSDKSVFCSELTTICLFRAGVLTDSENYPSNTDPGEVSEFSCFKGSSIRFLKYDI